MAKEKSDKNSKFDIFGKVANTLITVITKTTDMLPKKIDEVLKIAQKRAAYVVLMALGLLFLLLALAEFISVMYPMYGSTSGYLGVALVMFVIGLIYKKGMD